MNGGSPEPNLEPFHYGSIPPYEYPVSPIVDVAPEQPKRKPELVQPFQRPHKPFIGRVSPVQPVVPEKTNAPDNVAVVMSHPETVQLPPTQDGVSEPKPVGTRKPEARTTAKPTSTSGSKPVQKATAPVEKATKPVQKATGKGKIKKLDEYDGQLGRKHKEHEIEYILDTYLQTGLLPTYVTQKMRWNYKHHRRLPERRERLEQAGKHIVVPETAGTTGNIIPMERTNVHNKRVSR